MSDSSTETGGKRRGGRVAAVVLILALVAAGAGTAGLYILNLAPARPLESPVSFTIERGEPLSMISGRLEDLGIIRSGLVLRLIARVAGTSRSVQSGSYLFEQRFTAREMHDYLLSGSQVLRRVTIPEGLTMTKIAQTLEEAGITSAEAFVETARDPALMSEYGVDADSAEGFLFPDTYLFAQDYPVDAIVRHLVEKFFIVLEGIYPEYDTLSTDELLDKVTLASIVEREYRVPEEAATIASVFYNRLDVNMRLESCATVVYVITEIEGEPHPQRLYYADLDRTDPYNTYRSFGLPPGPISNPGRTALEAAFYPESTDYRFFVWNGPGSGSHSFTRTLSEHNEARLLYLKSP